jgi:dTDP-4-amino-4,6-dideoxy-D-galactose acyltransferase
VTPTVELLTWDSDFFGFPIGRVDLDHLDADGLREVDRSARAEGIRCLYGFLDPACYETSYLVQTAGYRFVEGSARFDLKPDLDIEYPPTDATIRRGTEADLPEIHDALLRVAPWSRYAVDPHFGLDAARRMNLAWVDRAARCRTDDHALMVAEDERGVIAFITRARHPVPIVDAVGTTAPGSGAARALMQDARSWAGDDGLWAGWAAARNINSYRFVENCGFRVTEVRYIYHRWLDEEPW